ncbi:MAG: outer membrane beta-barrel protein, partial [Cycloclasticus sp.]|nr:outer membrane beta-barrel protein [Cycloclasticus sp.]
MKIVKSTAAILAALGLTVVATPALSYEAGDILVRGRVIMVDPQDDSGRVKIDGSSVGGTGVSVDSDIMPEIDFTYMLAPNWGLELILAYSEHDVGSSGLALGNVAEVKVLPPTLTLQYHFAPNSDVRPYVGAGLNYTHFFSEDVKGPLNPGGADIDLDDSWGLALQAGVDIAVNEDWFVNLDVKYIDIDTDAHITDNVTGFDVDVDV